MQYSVTALLILIYALLIYNRSWKHHKVRRIQNMSFCPHVSSSNDTSKSYYRLNRPPGWNHDYVSSIKFLGAVTFKGWLQIEAMMSLKDNNHECLLKAKRHWNHLTTNHFNLSIAYIGTIILAGEALKVISSWTLNNSVTGICSDICHFCHHII